MISRREFLKGQLKVLLAMGFTSPFYNFLHWEAAWTNLSPYTRKALYSRKLPKKKIECVLCPRECTVSEGQRGFCGVRENKNGEYFTLVYGNPCSVHTDPIEKKPFFHFLPGSNAFSFSTAGCNLNCRFCQNWEISQSKPEDVECVSLPPVDLISAAIQNRCRSVVGTYAEPTVFYEYMLQAAKEARKRNLKSAIVSSGFINPEPLRELCRHVDAIKIDFKAYDPDFYMNVCYGKLKPVLESMKIIKNLGVWLEIVNLVIPTLNDDMTKIKDMSEWIKKNLGGDVPLHFSRFYPMYKMKNLPSTPISTLNKAVKTAREAGIEYVYVGNVPGNSHENTYCHKCRKLLIERVSYIIKSNNIIKGKCMFCKAAIPGVWQV